MTEVHRKESHRGHGVHQGRPVEDLHSADHGTPTLDLHGDTVGAVGCGGEMMVDDQKPAVAGPDQTLMALVVEAGMVGSELTMGVVQAVVVGAVRLRVLVDHLSECCRC